MKSGSALLIIDLINPFTFKDGGKAFVAARRIAPTVARAIAEFRRKGVPCIYVNDNFGEWKSDLPRLIARVGKTRGSELVDLLAPTDGDLFVLKPKHSAFYQTPLPSLLESLDVRSLVLCGIETDSCILATALDAHMREFQVRAPSNLCASTSPARHRAAMLLMRRSDVDTAAWKPG